jgi:hypothetical protein
MLPHYLLVNSLGGLMFTAMLFSVFLPFCEIQYQVANLFILTFIPFFVSINIFIRYEGVYDYCLVTFGEKFMIYYVGNPFSAASRQILIKTLIIATTLGYDAQDKHFSHQRGMEAKDHYFGNCQKLGIKLTPEDFAIANEELDEKYLATSQRFAKYFGEGKGKIDITWSSKPD